MAVIVLTNSHASAIREELIELDAARYSPVVSYILVTRVLEPDVELRAKIIEILGLIIGVNIFDDIIKLKEKIVATIKRFVILRKIKLSN